MPPGFLEERQHSSAAKDPGPGVGSRSLGLPPFGLSLPHLPGVRVFILIFLPLCFPSLPSSLGCTPKGQGIEEPREGVGFPRPHSGLGHRLEAVS